MLQAGQQDDVGCVLHRLAEDGFVYEYYLGVLLGGECVIVAALEPGEYQITLQPGALFVALRGERHTTSSDSCTSSSRCTRGPTA